MNFRHVAFVLGSALLLLDCETNAEVGLPTFPDGGLVRLGTPLSRAQLMSFEGMFGVSEDTDLFGSQVAIRTSPGTISVLTDHHAAFSVLESACLHDGRVVVEGYWQYPLETDVGLLRVFVDPPEVAAQLCNGETPTPTTDFKLNGYYGYDSDFPRKPISFTFKRELQPWRRRFFTTAHHGACENTDHCGASPNSLESIRLAERIGSNAAEVDVRVTRDGFPILFHDPGLSKSLVRGTFCNGQVAELSLPELLGACELRHGELIPTLEEALDMMVDETELEAVYLDMKVPGAVLPSARLVSQLNERLRERNGNADPDDDRRFTAAIAITTDEVRTAWHEAKDALTKEGLALPPCLLEYDPDLVISEGCVAWGPTWTEGPKVDDVQRLKDKGIATIFWTINQSDFIKDFLVQAQPHGIISARASMLFYLYQTVGTPAPVIDNQAP